MSQLQLPQVSETRRGMRDHVVLFCRFAIQIRTDARLVSIAFALSLGRVLSGAGSAYVDVAMKMCKVQAGPWLEVW